MHDPGRLTAVSDSSPLETKRGSGRGSYIDSVLAAVDDFYAEVLGTAHAVRSIRQTPTSHPEFA